ncbi:MAG TPA: YcbK family protein [Steroidobacteraceae bacterium]|nr:YcbK family protein [Steroidobacteraceae bacterium]
MSRHPQFPKDQSRRRFLARACGVVAGAGMGTRLALAEDSAPERRTVCFVHTHTGERLTADYFVAGRYEPGCLARVNYLLRDFRTGDVHPIDPTLLDLLFSLQTRSGHEAPYAVISGYRSPATNAMLRRTTEGVASHSMHLQGRAIDIRLPGYSTARLGELARGLARGGVGFYPRSDFVHVDTGRVRFW